MVDVDAVVVAAGGSTRFGGQDKVLAPLCGVPVLAWSLRALSDAGARRIVVVGQPANHPAFEALLAEYAPGREVAVVEGGERRRDSVEAGLRACSTRYVAIHDGARPLVTGDLIRRVVDRAAGGPGAIAAMPVTDTIKEVRDGVIRGHPERGLLWAAQTPQVVLRQAWLDAAGTSDNDETDDAAMLDRLGLACVVVANEDANLKITRPADLAVAEALLRQRED